MSKKLTFLDKEEIKVSVAALMDHQLEANRLPMLIIWCNPEDLSDFNTWRDTGIELSDTKHVLEFITQHLG